MSPIYVALDTPDIERAKAIATRVRHHVGGIKLGLEFFMANGRHGVHEMAEIGVPIFLVIGFWVVGVSMVIDFTLANVGVTLFEGLNFFGLLSLCFQRRFGHDHLHIIQLFKHLPIFVTN